MKTKPLFQCLTGILLVLWLLVGCGPTPRPAKITPTPTPYLLECVALGMTPTPTSTPTDPRGIPVSGQWTVTINRLGTWTFTVNKQSTAITEIDSVGHYSFTCCRTSLEQSNKRYVLKKSIPIHYQNG